MIAGWRGRNGVGRVLLSRRDLLILGRSTWGGTVSVARGAALAAELAAERVGGGEVEVAGRWVEDDAVGGGGVVGGQNFVQDVGLHQLRRALEGVAPAAAAGLDV